MGQQPTVVVGELSFSKGGSGSARENSSLRRDTPSVRGHRPQVFGGQVDRGVPHLGGQDGVDGASGGGVEHVPMTPPCTEPSGL